MYPVRLFASSFGLLLGLFSPLPGWAAEIVPSGYRNIANEYQIPPKVLYAVALTESGRSDSIGTLRPWPWTLNLRGRGFFYSSRREAWWALRRFLEQGKQSIDIGLMQVNWRYHKTKLVNPWLALDPYHNLRVAAVILRSCYEKKQDWWRGVGCYHSPGNEERATAYSQRAVKHWKRLAPAS